MTQNELKILQNLPLQVKILKSKQRIKEYITFCDKKVYISFSGGIDSVVLLDLVREDYPDTAAVYIDTGLEYPENREFVKTIDNVIVIKPKMTFKQVIEKYGYPVISKEIALTIEYARKGSQWAIDRLNGLHKWGNHIKYKFLLDSDFKISPKCCDIMKKQPVRAFEKETGLIPIVGTMAAEGGQRLSAYLKKGCNSFDSKRIMSTPIGFWTKRDIWEYIRENQIKYSFIYDKGYSRTGCMFCMFGINQEKYPNRFQLMRETHPKQYGYCINKLGCGKVLDFLGVPYN